jgi:hypothetical protein
VVATVSFADRTGFDKGAVIGYRAVVPSFLLVFSGIRSYRDTADNGYLHQSVGRRDLHYPNLVQEVLYFHFLPGFMDNYGAYMVERLRVPVLQPSRHNFSN